jgi:hypothetical protein
MNHSAFHRGRLGAMAPAAALLLALYLLAAGVQAMTDPVNPATLVTGASEVDSSVDLSALALAPYPSAHPVPGLVWARDYDTGGEAVAYHDTEPANLGGAYRPAEGVDIEAVGTAMDVGWIRDGEWLTYTVNATDPFSCTIVVEAANPDAVTKRVAILADGVPVGTVDLRPTGFFNTYADGVSTLFALPAGETAIRLSFDGVSRVNLMALDFQQTYVEPTPVPTPASELLVDTPGLHTLDRDLSADVVGVLVTSSDVVLDGMGHTIEGVTANATGVRAEPPTSSGTIRNVTVRNLTVRDCGTGIATNGVAGCAVEHVVAERNTVGLAVNAYGGTGSDHLVRDSAFRENSRAGIALGFQGRGASIERCSITGNGKGVTLDYFHSSDRTTTRIVDSTVSENTGTAISLTDISGLVVANCTVRGNGGHGVYVEHSGAEIRGCHIENNAGSGVQSSDRGGSDIHGNWIEGNGRGVVVGGDWGSFVRNNYFNNTDNGYFGPVESGMLDYEKTAGENIVGGPYLGGNFWANPNGTGFSQTHPDTDGDGICDEPFVVNPEEGVTDALPLAPAPGTPVIVPTPYRPLSIPGRIQAEDYDIGGETVSYHDTTRGNTGGAYRQDDVDIETGNGITDVGWIRDGEYLLYTVNVTRAGVYTMTARVASPNDGRSATISINADPMYTNIIRVPNTGSFETFATATEDYITLPAGTVTLRLTFHGDGMNLDWIELVPRDFGTPWPTPPVPSPFTPLAIPGTIQAEDYDLGGEGVAYHDTTPGNEGGAYRHDDVDIETGNGITNVGWIRSGEYLLYTANVTGAGAYTVTARVASPNSGRTLALTVDNSLLTTIAVPNTGSYTAFRTVEAPVSLSAGTHTLKLAFQGDGQNLDWIAFAKSGVATPTPTPTVTTSTPTPTQEAGGATFVAAPLTAPHGSAVRFTLTPAAGKTIGSAWWSFDAPAHLNTWNSRVVNPTFFYPSAGTFSPLVKITYTDGSTETAQRAGYIHVT